MLADLRSEWQTNTSCMMKDTLLHALRFVSNSQRLALATF